MMAGALVDVLGVELPATAALGLGCIVADLLSPGSRPEVQVAIVSPEGAHLERAELVVASYQREGLRSLAREIQRCHVRPGDLRVLVVGDGDPALRVLSLATLARRVAHRATATATSHATVAPRTATASATSHATNPTTTNPRSETP